MIIDVRTDVTRFTRRLWEIADRQVPFAVALGLTRTAKDIAEEVTREMPRRFDRPTRFTERSVAVEPARSHRWEARTFVKEIQAKYLGLQERGGQRDPKRRAIVLPGAVKLDRFGNIPKGAVRKLKERRNVFVGAVKGHYGLWQRTKPGHVKPLILFRPKVRYKPRFGFEAIARRVILRRLSKNIGEAFARALSTQR